MIPSSLRIVAFGGLILAAMLGHAEARGFGGFHGGGGFGGGGFGGGDRFSGAGFGGGGFSGGDRFSGGDFGGGGFGGGDFGGDRFSGGGAGLGGWGGDSRFSSGYRGTSGFGGMGRDAFGATNFASQPDRSQLNSFLGLPSDEGFSHLNSGTVDGPRGASFTGSTFTGPAGSTVGRGVVEGLDGGTAVVRGGVGANGGAAIQGAGVGADGRVAAGSAVRGPDGYGAARGVAAGPGGAVAGAARFTPVGRYTAGVAVRDNFHAYGLYHPGWYTAHPGAWFTAGAMVGSAWDAATWDSLDGWFGYPATTPAYNYDYGNSVVYQGSDVYVDQQPVGTATQYYNQAASLASGGDSQAPPPGPWLPLGVFALASTSGTDSHMVLQLALNKQGIVRGNYTDTVTNQTSVIEGSLDKKTQRVAWTIGTNQSTVFDTGLYNLTKDEAPLLIHYGTTQTEPWLLVRIQQPAKSAQASK
jgi:hypothetical protein